MLIPDPALGGTSTKRPSGIVQNGCQQLVVGLFLLCAFTSYCAADEEKQVRADENREAARERAESQLGYPYVFRDSRDRHVDFL